LNYNHLPLKYLFVAFSLIGLHSFSQLITTSTTLPVDQLVQQSLGNDCVDITNVTSSINGSVDGLNSFGSFTQSGSSFPFTNGFFLSTGDGNRIGNSLINTDLSDGTTAWGGDNDLENLTGISNTVNATVIEFDLISTSNRISFNYLLASEEYQQNFPCNVSDRFALLLRPQGGTYQNIAVLPGTTTPVGIDTVHPEVVGQCLAANETFFAGQMLGNTNFEGRTVPLTASANVIPNSIYHLKMVIADQSSFDPTAYDSAIFIEASSLRAEIDLGPDLFPCVDATLNADIGNNLATFRWFRDNIELVGETNSTILADISGNYLVEIIVLLPNSNCIITDEVLITIDPNQLNVSIADQEICDDASADGFESFDLLTIGNNTLSQFPAGNYTTAFYFNQIDAQNQVNQLSDNYTNVANPQTIYILINDLNTGCQSIRSLNLIVNDLIITSDYSFTVCDNNDDGIVLIDLAAIDSSVSAISTSTTTTTTAATVSYHLTESDAINNTGVLLSPYTNFSNPDTIYARVSSTTNGCFATSEITINIILPPALNSTLEEIDACDQDNDGFATYDITSVIPDFTSNPSDSNISYHLLFTDARDNNNPITTPSSFDNTVPRRQRVYIRFESIATGCSTVVPVDLYSNLLLDRTNIQNIIACDDLSNDGIENFLFDEISSLFIGALENVDIEFFETELDQMSDINQLDQMVDYANITNPQTIYIRINSPTCTELATFELIVEPYFQSGPIPDQTYCDEDQDLFTTVSLNEFDSAVRGSFSNDHNVLYYLSQTNADDRMNPVTSVLNTTNPFTVYAELIAPTGCSDNQTLQITILPAPVSSDPVGFLICDTDLDGFFVVDLTSQEVGMTTDTNRSFSYHNNFADAALGAAPILIPSAYNAQTETIFVRVENTLTGCETIVTQSIIVNTLPVFPAIDTYQLCESDGNNVEDFFFFTKDIEILNGQLGKTASYFRSTADANSRMNEIGKFNAFQNTSDPQTIWVRVENDTDTSCYAVDSFTIQVDASPTFNMPTDIRICDDNNDGISTYNLQPSIDEIRMGIMANLTVSFHESVLEAESNTNPLPIDFTNTVNPQTIYARIGNDVNCFEVEDILFNVIDSPLTNIIAASTACDTNLDGFNTFDLTARETELVGSRPFNSTLSWHTSFTDAENGLNPISNDSSYTNSSNPQTVYLRYYNTISECFDIGILDLIVSLPPQLNTAGDFTVCDNLAQTANLNEVIPLFIDPLPADVIASFYATDTDAVNNTNPLGNIYNYTTNNTTLFIRVENTTTSCFSTGDFNLRIQALPQITSLGNYDLRACDDNFDGSISFNLADNDLIILNGLDPATHSLQYYATLTDAEDDINEITNTNVIVNQSEMFFVRVTNTTLGCARIGEFEAMVDPLPLVTIDPYQVICNNVPVTIDASTGESGETYLWSTGETTSSININIAGNHSVQVTSARGCVAPTVTFNLIASETAAVEFVASTNFGDPNTITVTVRGSGDYQYILDNGPSQDSNIFRNVTRGYHEVSVIDINGCAPSPPQLVLIIDYPRFFTPNSDGFNDTWYVDEIDTFDKSTFYIFDRYGKLLKSYGNDFSGWDGTYNGNSMPSSDYWFLLEIEDSRGNFEVKGNFSLKR
jgi:gliding motility-associated-like protein